MAYVTPREGESPESLVNRFRASVQHAGILREIKDRRFFRSKAQKERLAMQRAARRRRRQRRYRPPNPQQPPLLTLLQPRHKALGTHLRACCSEPG